MAELDVEFNYDLDNNAEYIFISDTLEKKIISRKSIVSKHERLVPSRKELKRLNGGITIMNMYDSIMPYETFKSLPHDDKIKTFNEYYNRHGAKLLAESWGKKKQLIYGIKSSYNRINTPSHNKSDNENTTKKVVGSIKQGISILITRDLSGEKIQDLVMKCLELFDGSYKVKFLIEINSIKNSRIDYSIKLNNVFTYDELQNEVLQLVSFIPKEYLFRLYVQATEVMERGE